MQPVRAVVQGALDTVRREKLAMLGGMEENTLEKMPDPLLKR